VNLIYKAREEYDEIAKNEVQRLCHSSEVSAWLCSKTTWTSALPRTGGHREKAICKS